MSQTIVFARSSEPRPSNAVTAKCILSRERVEEYRERRRERTRAWVAAMGAQLGPDGSLSAAESEGSLRSHVVLAAPDALFTCYRADPLVQTRVSTSIAASLTRQPYPRSPLPGFPDSWAFRQNVAMLHSQAAELASFGPERISQAVRSVRLRPEQDPLRLAVEDMAAKAPAVACYYEVPSLGAPLALGGMSGATLALANKMPVRFPKEMMGFSSYDGLSASRDVVTISVLPSFTVAVKVDSESRAADLVDLRSLLTDVPMAAVAAGSPDLSLGAGLAQTDLVPPQKRLP